MKTQDNDNEFKKGKNCGYDKIRIIKCIFSKDILSAYGYSIQKRTFNLSGITLAM